MLRIVLFLSIFVPFCASLALQDSSVSFDLELADPYLEKRSPSMLQEDLRHDSNRYMMTFYLGSNKQKTRALIDTGLRTVNIYKNMYNPLTLSSAVNSTIHYTIQYIGQKVSGWLFQDKLTLPSGVSVDLKFGLCDESDYSVMAAFGLGNDPDRKKLLPWILKDSGHTKRAQFALYMDASTKKGKVQFGGLDSRKYEGRLVKNPSDDRGSSTRLYKMSASSTSYHSMYNMLLFDSGAIEGHMHGPDYDWLAATLKVRGTGRYRLISCNQPKNKYITFHLTNGVFKIPYQAFAKPEGKGCEFPLLRSNKRTVLGQHFMNYLYISCDYEDKTIAVAPYKK